MAKVKKKVLKAKKKFWFQVVAPKMFGGQVIGESYVSDAKLMKGKNLTVNLRALTDEIKNQNIKISFIIDDVKDNRANCSIIGYNLLPSAVKRMVSKGRVRVDEFVVCKTSDNINIRAKIVLVTINVTSNSVMTHMRKKVRELLLEKISKIKDSLLCTAPEVYCIKFLESINEIGLLLPSFALPWSNEGWNILVETITNLKLIYKIFLIKN